MSIIGDVFDWFNHITRHDDHYTVTVVRGDTLSEIAERYGHARDYQQIADLNPGMDAKYTIYPGQVLKIPREWMD